jgi:Golgi apyrase
MRLLPPGEQSAILTATCDFLRFHSDFRVGDSSSQGPCGSHVRVITGEEEGLFGWIAVNYLMESFSATSNSHTFGFLDMGGASTQIAFEPQHDTTMTSKENLHEVRLRLMNGNEISHKVFVTTWLGYGTNQARERYVERLAKSHAGSPTSLSDPCLPSGLRRVEKLTNGESSTILGTGSFSDCLSSSQVLLNKTVTCLNPPCLFNGVHVPRIDFDTARFIGVSEYWYSSEHVFGLGGAYNFLNYEKAASNFCASNWNAIVSRYRASSSQDTTGNQENTAGHADAVIIGKRENDVELARLEMQCFKAAWIVNILHEGLGLPRSAELKDASLADIPHDNRKEAIKGASAPTFQSLDTIEDTAVSWSLGTMILEASQEVSPKSTFPSELPHPMVKPPPMPSIYTDSDNSILEEETRPISSLLPLFLIFLAGTIFLLYLLRRTLLPILLQYIRRRRKKSDLSVEEGLVLESSHSSLLSRNGRLPLGESMTDSDKIDNHVTPPATQNFREYPTPSRSFGSSNRIKLAVAARQEPSSVDSPQNSRSITRQPSDQSISSLSSSHLIPAPDSQSVRSAHPLYALSLSRNSSQTNLVPRQTASRMGSGSLTPSGFVDD